MPIYDGTPAGDVRRGIASGTFVLKKDARKSADAMIAAIDAERPPYGSRSAAPPMGRSTRRSPIVCAPWKRKRKWRLLPTLTTEKPKQ
jgi:hypothetical protein